MNDPQAPAIPRAAGRPGEPRSIPVWGSRLTNWQAARGDLLGLLLRAAENCGDVVRVPVLHDSLVLVNDQAVLHHILVEAPEAFGRGRIHHALRRIVGEGMLTAENEGAASLRAAAAPAFEPARIAALPAIVERRIEPWLARWDEFAARGEVRPLAPELMGLTAQIAVEYFFAAELPLVDALTFVDDLATVQAHVYRRLSEPWAMWSPTAGRALARIEALARGFAPTAASAPLLPQAMTLLATAPEHPANTLAWALFLLGRDPDVASRAEYAAHAGDDNFLGAVIHESIRLYPSMWAFERMTLADTTVAGRSFPVGTQIVISPYILHRNRRHWQRPQEFRPERFLGRSPKELPGLTYMPFSAGTRGCPAESFAVVVTATVLRRLLARYRVELDAGEQGEPAPMFTLRPRTGVLARLQRIV